MKNFTLRRAHDKDADVLLAALLSSSSSDTGLDDSAVENGKMLVSAEIGRKTPNSVTYVIECADEKVGRLRLVDTDDEMFIGGLQLLPQYRGQGLGSSILHSLIERAARAHKVLRLNVDKNNVDAKRLYIRLGFVVVQELADEEVLLRLV